MFRPIITKDYPPSTTLRVPIPQRRGAFRGSTIPLVTTTAPHGGQQPHENNHERFLDISNSLRIPSNIFTSNNNNVESTAFVVPTKPPRPDTPRHSSYPSACSPLTICSETWRHSPSPFPNHDFVPITDQAVVAPAPLPLSHVLHQQYPWKTTCASESAYHPYATPSPIQCGSGRGRALLSPSLTADTCSVTTQGTDITAATFSSKWRSSPPLFVAPPQHSKQPQTQQHLRSPVPSSLAVAAGWSLPSTTSSARRIHTTTTSYRSSSSSTLVRPQSAPTLPPTTTTTGAAASTEHERKIRLKTELCMHYEHGRHCPFGTNCTYAHGPAELQMTKLQDLHEAGLVDMVTYRIKPCLTWIMTGSCPFGKRCTGIHDARVASSHFSSWLPHTETQGNTIATDINVEGLFQKRLYEILYDNPLGDAFDLQEAMQCPQAAFDNLYALVCGESHAATHQVGGGHSKQNGRGHHHKATKGTNSTTTASKKGGARGGRTVKMVHPIYKLQIALKLRGEADWHYKYRPQHVVHDELCMVLQKRAFRVTGNATTNTNTKNQSKTKASLAPLLSQRLTRSTATAISSVQEIDLRAYNAENNNHILVHEIAFGPDADPSVRGVALWFNIDEDAVTLCTPQQAKRFRWKKSMPMAATKPVPTKFDVQNSPTISVFDSPQLECFPMIRPHNEAAFRLVTDMLKHRLAVLKRERMTTLNDRLEHLRKLEEQKVLMRDERFVNQVRDWVAWAWPVNAGRERVGVHTPVPPVEGPYCIADPDESNIHDKEEDPAVDQENQVPNLVKGAHARRIWKSFVEMSFEQEQGENSAKRMASAFVPRRRLAIFQDLANGKEIDTENRALPHIIEHRATTTTPSSGKNSKSKTKVVDKPSSRHPERCWKALLLLPENYPHGNNTNTNEWTIVRQHFSNSRSHKVLTILQQ